MRHILSVAALAVMLSSGAVWGDEVRIDEIITASADAGARQEAVIAAAKTFYQFWNDGDDARLNAAISPSFTDHTLPAGRPQGPQGPGFASKQFRSAVSDLRVEVRKMIVAGDYVTVHMQFKGHFTGEFGKTKGNGQSIDFIATDLLKVTDGRISDNWHIEDNLTLLSKMGVAKLDQ